MTDHLTFGWPCYAVALIVRAGAAIVKAVILAAYVVVGLTGFAFFLLWIAGVIQF